MLLSIPDVLTPQQVAEARDLLDKAPWIDGRATAGYQSAQAKDNMQVPEDHPSAQKVGDMITAALSQNPLFLSAALPLKVFPPLFNRYQLGQAFGTHVDNAIRYVKGTPVRIRTDVSATLFLTDPKDYDGGELIVEDTYGLHSIKLPAGHMILYPATSLHHVKPVSKGARISSFFWIQSMVKEDSRRAMLFDLDTAIQRLAQDHPGHPSAVQITGVYHNLVRQWAEV